MLIEHHYLHNATLVDEAMRYVCDGRETLASPANSEYSGLQVRAARSLDWVATAPAMAAPPLDHDQLAVFDSSRYSVATLGFSGLVSELPPPQERLADSVWSRSRTTLDGTPLDESEIEFTFAITSVRVGKMTATELAKAVRGHWRIEHGSALAPDHRS